MTWTRQLPVVLCGRNSEVSAWVTKALQPEYQVIRSILCEKAGQREIPSLLAESPGFGSVGTAEAPVAVVVGGGYSQEDLELLRAACQGLRPVTWVKVLPKGSLSSLPPPSEYGSELGERIKRYLNQLEEKGQLGEDCVHGI
ncbi:hypothetical protein ABOM_006216 [Aspergillus bombycis]|uniref:Uncharacterized protein n=1 Tax=Aspergillus bombycis TaxID=109264 RepID=A0A1F7ZZ97_9EURO|nr:hypothetical protein ABOM_006216 [Aspergillus bombycis]OGM44793.1 hypothetical protein ABOM_006216 [Aspergillus bombycis]